MKEDPIIVPEGKAALIERRDAFGWASFVFAIGPVARSYLGDTGQIVRIGDPDTLAAELRAMPKIDLSKVLADEDDADG